MICGCGRLQAIHWLVTRLLLGSAPCVWVPCMPLGSVCDTRGSTSLGLRHNITPPEFDLSHQAKQTIVYEGLYIACWEKNNDHKAQG